MNPRRLVRHPQLPVLYVATASQVIAFDITDGNLVSLCGPDGGAAPPCATVPGASSNPVDMKFLRNSDGRWLLYVVERGGGNNLDTLTRVVAYELRDDGGLPSQPSSQVQTTNALSYQGAEFTQEYAFVADAGQSNITRFPLRADGNLPNPIPTGTPPTPTPTPSPIRLDAGCVAEPDHVARVEPEPHDQGRGSGRAVDRAHPVGIVFYVVEQGRRRIGAIPVVRRRRQPAEEPDQRVEHARHLQLDHRRRGLRRRTASTARRCRTAARSTPFQVDSDGNIIDGTLSAHVREHRVVPTGVALVSFTPAGGRRRARSSCRLGGFNRVDAYAVNPTARLPELPLQHRLMNHDVPRPTCWSTSGGSSPRGPVAASSDASKQQRSRAGPRAERYPAALGSGAPTESETCSAMRNASVTSVVCGATTVAVGIRLASTTMQVLHLVHGAEGVGDALLPVVRHARGAHRMVRQFHVETHRGRPRAAPPPRQRCAGPAWRSAG